MSITARVVLSFPAAEYEIPMPVPIATARTAREESLIERILDEAGIPYSFTLDAAEGHSVCFLARMYEVESVDADRARDALRARGAAAAVVDAP